MNKKAKTFPFWIAVAYFILLLLALGVLYDKASNQFNNPIGEKAMELFETYSEGEKAQVYLQESVKQSRKLAEHEVGKTGGLVITACDVYINYPHWVNAEGKECYPGGIVNNTFISYFDEELAKYLGNYRRATMSSSFIYEEKQGILNARALVPTKIEVRDTRSFTGELDYFPLQGATEDDFEDTWAAGRSDNRRHEGVDIFAEIGRPYIAVKDGTIARVGCNKYGGNRIGFTDSQGIYYYYAHLDRYAKNPATGDFWKVGDEIKAGQVIGYNGDTVGCYADCTDIDCGIKGQTDPHLHFGIYIDDIAVNPYNALRRKLDADIKTTYGTAGIYLINPSFQLKLPIIQEYKMTEQSARELIQECQTKQDLNVLNKFELTECVEEKASEKGIVINCDDEIEKPVYDFLEQIQECKESLDTECSCEISFDETLEIKGNAITHESFTSLNLPEIKGIPEKITDKITVTKTIDDEDEVVFEVGDIGRECKINKRTYRLCKQTGEIYLGEGKKESAIKFALYINDSAAPPAYEIEDFDIACKDERNAVVSWKQSPAPDVKSYVVYYSPEPYTLPRQAFYETSELDAKVYDTTVPTCSTIAKGASKLYFKDNMYYYKIEKPRDQNYFITVTAKDFDGNEVENLAATIAG